MDSLDNAANRKRKRELEQNEDLRPQTKQRKHRKDIPAEKLSEENLVAEKSKENGDTRIVGQVKMAKSGEINPEPASHDTVTSKKRQSRGEKRQKQALRKAQDAHGSNPQAVEGDGAGDVEKHMPKERPNITSVKSSDTTKTARAADEQAVAGAIGVSVAPGKNALQTVKDGEKATKKGKKKARQEGNTIDSTQRISQPMKESSSIPGTEIIKTKAEKAKKIKNKASQSSKASRRPLAWAMSEPAGGKFLDVDPIFTPDERYIIFGTESTINVYSSSNSLLLHSFPAGSSGRITAFTLSGSYSDTIYVGTDKGHILKWNITNGKRIGRWSIATRIHAIHAEAVDGKKEDILYIIDKSKTWEITAHRFGIDDDPSKTDLAVLVNVDKPLHSLQVVDEGRVLVTMTSEGLLIGSAGLASVSNLKQLKYSWKEVKCEETPSCFSANMVATASKHSTNIGSSKSTIRKPISSINVAVGGTKGGLFVYQDVVNKPGQTPSMMHWHREAVGAVAWSLDGNYIITGGRETVLVLWQLETGRKQFLPNLESPICNLVVSPSGSSYAVRLGDNSVMVLSTAELTPTANIVGLQSLAFMSKREFIISPPTVESLIKHGKDEPLRHTACVISPHSLNHIIVAAPSYQPGAELAPELVAAPYIQTFDIANSRHAARQALARTNATSTNLGPEGNRIIEPNITMMQVSSNGKWLATVDEWYTPRQDMAEDGSGSAKMDVTPSRETHLKFWSWNTEQEEWMLNSRIVQPHQKENSLASEVILDLVSDPSRTRFATLGVDSSVRVWTPRSKTSSGKIIRGERKSAKPITVGQVDTWWSLEYNVSLQSATATDLFEAVDASRGKLAFSNDGSTLAVYLCHGAEKESTKSMVHFIDTYRGSIQTSRTKLCPEDEEIHDFGFLDRYLICVGRHLISVWDITSFSLHFETPITSAKSAAFQSSHDTSKTPLTLLAINKPSSTFAVAVPQLASDVSKSKVNPLMNYHTKLSIFSATEKSKPLFERTIPRTALALISASTVNLTADDTPLSLSTTVDQKGYVVLDASAEIRTIRFGPPAVHGQSQKKATYLIEPSTTVESDKNDRILASLQPGNIVESRDSEGGVTPDWAALLTKLEDSRPVVRTQQLAGVFDYPSHAMPPMMEMFKSVVNLYAGKA